MISTRKNCTHLYFACKADNCPSVVREPQIVMFRTHVYDILQKLQNNLYLKKYILIFFFLPFRLKAEHFFTQKMIFFKICSRCFLREIERERVDATPLLRAVLWGTARGLSLSPLYVKKNILDIQFSLKLSLVFFLQIKKLMQKEYFCKVSELFNSL